MLITPEQKPEHISGVCDNHNEQKKTDDNNDIYNSTEETLDNSNLRERTDFDEEKLSNEKCDDCSNTSASSYADVKNSNTQIPYSPRSLQRLKAKFPPHINLSNAKKTSPSCARRALFISDDVSNESTHPVSPMSASPTRSPTQLSWTDNDKQEVFAGRLYLIRHTGNVSPSPSPSSPSRVQLKGSPFQMSTATFSSPASSPVSPSSPTISTKRKTPVYMRVYKCNMDHFALVSRDSSYSSRATYLNMRHSRVLPGDCLGRFIIAGHCDSGSLMEFETTDLSSLEKWLDALQAATPPGSPIRLANGASGQGNVSGSSSSPPITKVSALPTLAETEEEN